jgi:hypothetical protein
LSYGAAKNILNALTYGLKLDNQFIKNVMNQLHSSSHKEHLSWDAGSSNSSATLRAGRRTSHHDRNSAVLGIQPKARCFASNTPSSPAGALKFVG